LLPPKFKKRITTLVPVLASVPQGRTKALQKEEAERHQSSPNLRVRAMRLAYAPRLNAVRATTALPLVLNFLRPRPSPPTSLKNWRLPSYRLYSDTPRTAAP
jgi:hypothetical protein